MSAGESRDSRPNSERHKRTTERATAALGVRKVTPLGSQRPAASRRPVSSERSVGLGPEAVWAASSRRTSEAKEGSLAHLLCQSLRIVAHPGLGRLGEKNALAYPDAKLLNLFAIHLHQRSPLRLVAGEELLRYPPGVDEHIGDHRSCVISERAQVLRERKAHSLPRLGHDVSRVENRSRKVTKRLSHPRAEQCWDGGGEEASWAQDYNVCSFYGRDHTWRSRGALRFHLYPCDRLTNLPDHRLPAGHAPV